MKICIVCDDVYPAHGGRGKSTERWAEKLAERGHKVSIFAARNRKHRKREFIGDVEVYRFTSIVIPRTHRKFFLGIPFPTTIYRILDREKFDIIIVNSQYYLGYLTLSHANNFNIPVISAIHTQPENITKRLTGHSFVNKLIYKIIIKASNFADAVIVPSKFAAKLVKRYGLKKKPIVISNGIDLKNFNPNINAKEFTKLFDLKNELKVLYVGRLMKEKNIDCLIKSFSEVVKEIPNSKLIIVGDGPLKRHLKRIVRRLKIKNNVVFTGYIEDSVVKQAFVVSDLFVLPSLVELQGIVLLEAMAFGKPILVAQSKTSAATELVVPGKNGYTFNPNNQNDLTNKIIKILKDKNLRLRMSENSIKFIKNHNMEKSIDELEKLCNKLIKC